MGEQKVGPDHRPDVGERRGTGVDDEHRGDSAGISDTVTVTCALDSQAHQIPDSELTAPYALRSGRYRAVCGCVVTAAPMVQPEGEPCRTCAAIVSPPARSRRGRSGLRRLLA
ncbi:hypothetical protein [Pseudonocardia sp.]|jgi:hypothetical protein|uniref:hypothetical protein n=1 Tax=Pseudonocardia sp. TaxID=60912 RepID=UPI0031FD1659